MNVSLYQAASALQANAKWQEVISENLASSSVPGFKKQQLSFSEVQAGLMGSNTAQHFSLPKATSSTSFQQGELKFTGSNTDVALEGPGFFEVQLANGSAAYTRDGEFQVNSEGMLVNKQGSVVIGQSGPIQMDRNNAAPISISATGDVSQGAEIRGTLKVINVNDPQLLTSIGGGSFLANNPNIQVQPVTDASLRPGFLEGANTTPVVEMANLISVMRSFEANQRIIQMQDDRMSKAISELGNPT
ncbi:MAG: flagellar basal body rod protein [Verrucomicrobiales bacterium]|nr:flagellar basal body rod protein [Verrucomicrobiales bacterium]